MSEGVVFTFMCGRFMIKRNSQPRVSVNGQSRLEIFAFLRTERLLPHHPPLFFSWTGEGGGGFPVNHCIVLSVWGQKVKGYVHNAVLGVQGRALVKDFHRQKKKKNPN